MIGKNINVDDVYEYVKRLHKEYGEIKVPRRRGFLFSEPDYCGENFKDGRLMGYTDVMNFINKNSSDTILTPEILERNGFERYHDNGTKDSWITMWASIGPDGEGDIEIDFRDDDEIRVKIDTAGSRCPGSYVTTQNVMLVGQLNTLFEVIGIDKKIK